MFKNLLDLKLQRTTKQAVGFYIAYLFLIIFISAILGSLYGLITGVADFYAGAVIGNSIAVVCTIAIASTLVVKKNIVNIRNVLLVLSSGVLALLVGSLIGLIPVAYLSMQADDSSPSFFA